MKPQRDANHGRNSSQHEGHLVATSDHILVAAKSEIKLCRGVE